MQTNKITATIVIEDKRSIYERVIEPWHKYLCLDDKYIDNDKCDIKAMAIIEESDPLSFVQILDETIRYTMFTLQAELCFNGNLTLEDANRYIDAVFDNWNWQQDCSN
jgi:hypothetical protein